MSVISALYLPMFSLCALFLIYKRFSSVVSGENLSKIKLAFRVGVKRDMSYAKGDLLPESGVLNFAGRGVREMLRPRETLECRGVGLSHFLGE